jgi:hypothetical protein
MYTAEELEALKEFCGEVVVLEPQATTSTTARIRSLIVGHGVEVQKKFKEATNNVTAILKEVQQFVANLMGGE